MKDVAGRALDCEVFVERADERVIRLEQNAIVGDFRDRAAIGDRHHARSSASAHAPVHLIAMNERAATAVFRRETLADHFQHGVEIAALQFAIRPRSGDELEHLVFAVVIAGRLRDDLLREDVERCVVGNDPIELAAFHGTKKRRALDEIVARNREKPALWHSRDGVA